MMTGKPRSASTTAADAPAMPPPATTTRGPSAGAGRVRPSAALAGSGGTLTRYGRIPASRPTSLDTGTRALTAAGPSRSPLPVRGGHGQLAQGIPGPGRHHGPVHQGACQVNVVTDLGLDPVPCPAPDELAGELGGVGRGERGRAGQGQQRLSVGRQHVGREREDLRGLAGKKIVADRLAGSPRVAEHAEKVVEELEGFAGQITVANEFGRELGDTAESGPEAQGAGHRVLPRLELSGGPRHLPGTVLPRGTGQVEELPEDQFVDHPAPYRDGGCG